MLGSTGTHLRSGNHERPSDTKDRCILAKKYMRMLMPFIDTPDAEEIRNCREG